MRHLVLTDNSPLKSTDFIFGIATSSFQVEGDSASREETIWDRFCKKPYAIKDNSNAEPGCEHIKRWVEDVDLIESFNVDAYRLSISWARVMNNDGSVNAQGLSFYQQLVSSLFTKGIKVFVTLYHWDLPQHLEAQGGWLNRATAIEFEKYSEVVVQALKGHVYSYATLNEPWCSAYLGYEVGIHAPGKEGRENGLKAAHHLLLAHGLAMKVLNRISPESKNGIVLNLSPCYPLTDSGADKQAAKFAHDYFNDWYLMPVLKGVYPKILRQFDQNNLDYMKSGDLDLIHQPLDYIGINYYTRSVFKACKNNNFEPCPAQTQPTTDMGWELYPQGLTEVLVDIHQRYDLPPVYITENGAAMKDELNNGQVDDDDRIRYFQTHLNALESAMSQGVDVRGYFAWSLMDNFEWAEGYEKRFGLVYVDFKTQKRTIKNSGEAYRQLLKARRSSPD